MWLSSLCFTIGAQRKKGTIEYETEKPVYDAQAGNPDKYMRGRHSCRRRNGRPPLLQRASPRAIPSARRLRKRSLCWTPASAPGTRFFPARISSLKRAALSTMLNSPPTALNGIISSRLRTVPFSPVRQRCPGRISGAGCGDARYGWQR